jgi:ribosome-associated toxin RatA of RatAB toxin-antitoxin module
MEQVEHVSERRLLAAASPDVWASLLETKRFAARAANVRNVSLERIDAEREVQWTVWLKGFEHTWRERQNVDPVRQRIDFQQSQGMFRIYRGHWAVSAGEEGATEVTLEIEVDTGLPYLAQFINPVVGRAFKTFARDLIDGLEQTTNEMSQAPVVVYTAVGNAR